MHCAFIVVSACTLMLCFKHALYFKHFRRIFKVLNRRHVCGCRWTRIMSCPGYFLKDGDSAVMQQTGEPTAMRLASVVSHSFVICPTKPCPTKPCSSHHFRLQTVRSELPAQRGRSAFIRCTPSCSAPADSKLMNGFAGWPSRFVTL